MRRYPRRLRHGEEATLVEHLGELRARIFICLAAVICAFAITYAFHDRILIWMNRPLPEGFKPTTFSPIEPFSTSLLVSLWAALLLTMPLLLWQLLAGALLAGAATLMLAALALGAVRVTDPLRAILAGALTAQGLILLAELFGSHPNQDVLRAARTLTHGELSGWFWGGVVVGGIGFPLILLVGGAPGLAVSSLLALAGLWLYEMLWVRAGQSVPLS